MNERDAFFRRYSFAPDPFQVEAARAWDVGESVVVAAPTGSGKTVVAEYAIEQALARGEKVFYTTPLKALSNQKFGDFGRAYGAARVGLLTGDNSVNAGAPLVVMTTEVLRNMIYEQSARLDGLAAVVLDEVHYLQDRFRGAVWEEVIIHLPPEVRLVCLSATVSNADEFAEWVATLRGPTRPIVAEGRPVPLHQLLCVGDKRSDTIALLPLLAPGNEGERGPHPALLRLEDKTGRRRGSRLFTPRRLEVLDLLDDRSMLPAIVFVFSRSGCDGAAQTCIRAGVRLVERERGAEARRRLDARVKGLTDDELSVLGYGWFSTALEAGVAPHHAGLVPAFKEAVEESFMDGLVRLVFATETLSLGINMPARSVVIERLSKFTGEAHEVLTAGEFTQLTGRAGRRGIDTVGYAVVLWSPWIPVDRVADLAGKTAYPLTSSFRPDYNMAANLVRRYSRNEATDLLNSSFAQFRTDRDLVRMEATLTRRRHTLEAYEQAAHCERGDVAVYRRLLTAANAGRRSQREQRGARAEYALMRSRLGDVMQIPTRRGRFTAVVVSRAHSRGGAPVLGVVREDGRAERVGVRDLTEVPVRLGSVELPRPLAPRSPEFRRAVVRAMADSSRSGGEAVEEETEVAPPALEEHPVHGCPDRDRHITFRQRSDDLRREIDRLEERVRRRAGALAAVFDRVLEVLERLGYVDPEGWSLTRRGETLATLYSEVDLLATEALAEGVFDGLGPPELAAMVSCLSFEPRGEEAPIPLPGGARLRESLARLRAIWRDVAAVEEDLGLPVTREPHEGFADYVYRWARGDSLDEVLGDEELPGGDFVRQAKQVIDLLRQLAMLETPSDQSSAPFGEAADRLERGVVAYSSL